MWSGSGGPIEFSNRSVLTILAAIFLAPDVLAPYVGAYRFRPDSKSAFVVRSDGRQLSLLFDDNRTRVDLVPNSRRKFSMRRTAAHVEFELDGTGKATALSLHVAGSSFTVKRTFP